MGRELQKRKRRSSRATVRQPTSHKKPLNPMGNSIVAKNWDKKQTLSQNYRRLGLVAKLGRVTGGVEPDFRGDASRGGPAARDPLAVKPLAQQIVTEARVELDADGKIVRVLGRGREGNVDDNPLNDPLLRFDSDNEDTGEEWGGIDDDEEDVVDEEAEARRPAVIRELERQAGLPTEKRPRHQSRAEVEWLERLVGRHGDNAAAMARDRKLNPMQQTEADIARRLKKWKASGAKA